MSVAGDFVEHASCVVASEHVESRIGRASSPAPGHPNDSEPPHLVDGEAARVSDEYLQLMELQRLQRQRNREQKDALSQQMSQCEIEGSTSVAGQLM